MVWLFTMNMVFLQFKAVISAGLVGNKANESECQPNTFDSLILKSYNSFGPMQTQEYVGTLEV